MKRDNSQGEKTKNFKEKEKGIKSISQFKLDAMTKRRRFGQNDAVLGEGGVVLKWFWN